MTVYNPPGPVATSFMESDKFIRGIMGPVGSGKSVACCIEIFRRACQQEPDKNGVRRTRWAVIRNTYPELTTTTIQTWFEWVDRSCGKWRSQGPPTHFLNFELNDGTRVDAEVLFLALDSQEDAKKLLSLELTGAWLNEAREIPLAILNALVARIPRFPPKRDGGATWYGIIMDTNPPDTDSWWYKMAELKTPDNAEFFRQPGGMDPRAENIDNLPTGREYYNNIRKVNSEDFCKVHVDGEYGFVMDGKPVYPEFKHSMHVENVEKYKKAPLYIGIDFGLTPAAAICQKGPRGEWLVLDEVVTEDMGTARFAEILGDFLKKEYADHKMYIYGDPSGDNRAQTDEVTPFQILRKAGIFAIPAPSNDSVLRKESLRAPLSRLVDGIPGMRVTPRCEQIIKGLQGGYHYKRMRISGKDKFKDVPEKNMSSHIIEALEYATLGAGEGRKVLGASRSPKHLQYENRGIV